MLITELGAVTTIMMGLSLGFGGFAILTFWLQLFSKTFSENSKFYWSLFWINEIVWTVGVSIISYDWLNDNFDKWAVPFMICYFGSIAAMAIAKIFNLRK